MFGFLGFLLILFLLIIFIGFSILGNILRVLFGWGKRPPTYRSQPHTGQKTKTYGPSSANEDEEPAAHSTSSRHKKKIFDKDEGEYVDYEEVK